MKNPSSVDKIPKKLHLFRYIIKNNSFLSKKERVYVTTLVKNGKFEDAVTQLKLLVEEAHDISTMS